MVSWYGRAYSTPKAVLKETLTDKSRYAGPIKRLYGAGEMGSIWGFLYQSGGNLTECLGRMVGTHAAAESPLILE